MDEKISFPDYGIEFSNEDFENVDLETLKRCKARLEEAIKKAESKGDE